MTQGSDRGLDRDEIGAYVGCTCSKTMKPKPRDLWVSRLNITSAEMTCTRPQGGGAGEGGRGVVEEGRGKGGRGVVEEVRGKGGRGVVEVRSKGGRGVVEEGRGKGGRGVVEEVRGA